MPPAVVVAAVVGRPVTPVVAHPTVVGRVVTPLRLQNCGRGAVSTSKPCVMRFATYNRSKDHSRGLVLGLALVQHAARYAVNERLVAADAPGVHAAPADAVSQERVSAGLLERGIGVSEIWGKEVVSPARSEIRTAQGGIPCATVTAARVTRHAITFILRIWIGGSCRTI